MRVTLDIDDELFRVADSRASALGATLDDLIERALNRHLEVAGGSEGGPHPLPAFPGTGMQPGVDLTSNASLYDAMYVEEDVAARSLARGGVPPPEEHESR